MTTVKLTKTPRDTSYVSTEPSWNYSFEIDGFQQFELSKSLTVPRNIFGSMMEVYEVTYVKIDVIPIDLIKAYYFVSGVRFINSETLIFDLELDGLATYAHQYSASETLKRDMVITRTSDRTIDRLNRVAGNDQKLKIIKDNFTPYRDQSYFQVYIVKLESSSLLKIGDGVMNLPFNNLKGTTTVNGYVSNTINLMFPADISSNFPIANSNNNLGNWSREGFDTLLYFSSLNNVELNPKIINIQKTYINKNYVESVKNSGGWGLNKDGATLWINSSVTDGGLILVPIMPVGSYYECGLVVPDLLTDVQIYHPNYNNSIQLETQQVEYSKATFSENNEAYERDMCAFFKPDDGMWWLDLTIYKYIDVVSDTIRYYLSYFEFETELYTQKYGGVNSEVLDDRTIIFDNFFTGGITQDYNFYVQNKLYQNQKIAQYANILTNGVIGSISPAVNLSGQGGMVTEGYGEKSVNAVTPGGKNSKKILPWSYTVATSASKGSSIANLAQTGIGLATAIATQEIRDKAVALQQSLSVVTNARSQPKPDKGALYRTIKFYMETIDPTYKDIESLTNKLVGKSVSKTVKMYYIINSLAGGDERYTIEMLNAEEPTFNNLLLMISMKNKFVKLK